MLRYEYNIWMDLFSYSVFCLCWVFRPVMYRDLKNQNRLKMKQTEQLIMFVNEKEKI
jgi:hypothetical protein